MTITCDRTLLHAALAQAARAVNQGATVDILRGILLHADGDILTVTGNDLELGIVTTLPAEVEQAGAAVFDAKLFVEIIKKASGGTVTISVSPQMMAKIQSGLSFVEMSAMSADNYPALPKVDELRTLELPQASLKRQLSQTLFAVADGDAKGIHTGVLFDVETDKLTLVALNGHRLALRHEPISSEEAYRFVVPGKSLRELEKMLGSDEESSVVLHIGERHALFDVSGCTVVSRLLEGEFLKYKNALPTSCTHASIINRKSMLSGLERVGLIANDRLKSPVKLIFGGGRLELLCQTPLGRAQEKLTTEGDRSDMVIGFNHRYLVEALRRMESERFRFESSGTFSPCLLVPEDDENALFMVLPVRLKGEG